MMPRVVRLSGQRHGIESGTVMPDLSWRNKRKLKSLREHGGRAALATVVEFDKRWGVPENGYGGMPLGHSEHYTLRIRVEPLGEPAFEAEIKEHDFLVTGSSHPEAGDQFAVVRPGGSLESRP